MNVRRAVDRLERRRRADRLRKGGQGFGERRLHLHCARRQNHAPARVRGNQERIVEGSPQTGELGGQGGLGQAKALRSPAYVALLKEDAEHREKV